jgi:hypothetical protein
MKQRYGITHAIILLPFFTMYASPSLSVVAVPGRVVLGRCGTEHRHADDSVAGACSDSTSLPVQAGTHDGFLVVIEGRSVHLLSLAPQHHVQPGDDER